MAVPTSDVGPYPPPAIGCFLTSLTAPLWSVSGGTSCQRSTGPKVRVPLPRIPSPVTSLPPLLELHSFTQTHLLRARSVPDAVPGAENTVSRRSQDPCPWGTCLLGGRRAGRATDNNKCVKRTFLGGRWGSECCGRGEDIRTKGMEPAAVLTRESRDGLLRR